MDEVLNLVYEYQQEQRLLKIGYQEKINDKFGKNLKHVINQVKYILIELTGNELNRYIRFYTHCWQRFLNKHDVNIKTVENDNETIITQMLFEKLQDEYVKIKNTQEKICTMLQLAEDTSIDTILNILNMINDVFENVLDNTMRGVFMDMKNVYLTHNELKVKFNAKLFNLSEDEDENSINGECENKSINNLNHNTSINTTQETTSNINSAFMYGGSNCDILDMNANTTQPQHSVTDSCLRPCELSFITSFMD